jgi:superfamily II RNA helicase
VRSVAKLYDICEWCNEKYTIP